MIGFLTLSIVLGFVLDLILGDPRWFPHPVKAMGKFIASYEKQFRRLSAGLGSHLALTERIAGIILVVLTVGGSYAITWSAIRAADVLHPVAGLALETLVIYASFALRSLKDHVRTVLGFLKSSNIEDARSAVSMIVGRDTGRMDQPDILRAVVETTAESTGDGIISPLFYAVLGGAPLAMAYKAINTLDSMVGYRDETYRYFGWASAKLDDLANYLPARLTAILILAARPFFRTANHSRTVIAFGRVIRDAGLHPSPNSGYPESAMAWKLGVCLGGLNYYGGIPQFRPHMGPGEPPTMPEQAESALRITCTASYIGLIVAVLVGLV